MLLRTYNITILLIICITPLLFINSMMWGFITPKELFLQIAVFLLLALQLAKPATCLRLNLLDLLLLACVLVPMAVTIMMGDNQDFSGRYTLSLYLVMFFLFLKMMDDKGSVQPINKFLEKAFSLVSVIGLLMAIYGVLQHYQLDVFHPKGFTPFGPRVIGTIGHANAFGGCLAAILPLVAFNAFKSSKRHWRLISAVAVLFMIWALILTISRGAWLALIVSSLIVSSTWFKSLWQRYFNRIISKIAGIAVVSSIIVAGFWGIYQINPESAQGRLFIWRITLNIFEDHPITGIGYGRYEVEYLNYQANFFDSPSNTSYFDRAANLKQADNEYLQVLAETGLMGFVLFVLLLAVFFITAYRILKETKSRNEENWPVLALVTTVMVIAIHSLVDNPLKTLPTLILFYFALGMVSWQATHLGLYSVAGKFKISIKNHLILLLLGIGMLAYNAYDAILKGKGYIHWREGQERVREGNWLQGIEEYKQAIKTLSNKGELQFHLGAAYAYTKQTGKALPLLKKSQETFNDKNIYLVQGTSLLQLGRYKEAETSFLTALRMYPKLLLPQLWLAEMYLQNNRRCGAIDRLREIVTIRPKVMTEEAKSIKRDAKRLLELIGDKEPESTDSTK